MSVSEEHGERKQVPLKTMTGIRTLCIIERLVELRLHGMADMTSLGMRTWWRSPYFLQTAFLWCTLSLSFPIL